MEVESHGQATIGVIHGLFAQQLRLRHGDGVNGEVSHDKVTQFLSAREYMSKDLWWEVKTTHRCRPPAGIGDAQRTQVALHAHQFYLYGELYGLLGYGSLPFFFIFGYGLKRVYIGLTQESPFIFTIKRLVILIFF